QLLRDGAAAAGAFGQTNILQERAYGRWDFKARIGPEIVVLNRNRRVDQLWREFIKFHVRAPPFAERFVKFRAVAVVIEGAFKAAVVVDTGHLRLKLLFEARAQRRRQHQRDQRQAAAEGHDQADKCPDTTGRAAQQRATARAFASRQPGLTLSRRR